MAANKLATTALCLVAVLSLASQAAGKITPSKYELKFQNEPENATLHKRERQQQLFRCQVRLAPLKANQVNGASSNLIGSRSFKSHNQSVDSIDHFDPPLRLTNHPQRVNLTITWLKNGEPLENVASVYNVELAKKSNTSAHVNTTSATATIGQQDKRSRSRIEIKNTLNAKQLKLTSRLKVSQLKVTDSGQYKCVARVTFIQVQPTNTPNYKGDVTAAENNNKHEEQQQQQVASGSQLATSSEKTAEESKRQLPLTLRLEQELESSGSSLMVTRSLSTSNGNHSNEEPGGQISSQMDERSRKFSPTSGRTEDHDKSHRLAVGNDNSHASETGGQSAKGKQIEAASSLTSWWPLAATTSKSTSEDTTYSDSLGTLQVGDNEHQQQHQLQLQLQLQQKLNHEDPAKTQQSKSRGPTTTSDPFEDDEDLYKSMDQMTGSVKRPNDLGGVGGDSDEFELQRLRADQEGGEVVVVAADGEPADGDNQSMTPSRGNNHDDELQGDELLATKLDHWGNKSSSPTRRVIAEGGNSVNYIGDPDEHSNNQHKDKIRLQTSTLADYLGGGNLIESMRFKLAEFVHGLAASPKFGCYIGRGEQYRGNASKTLDDRRCLNWAQVKGAYIESVRWSALDDLSPQKESFIQSNAQFNEDNNYCRNPNKDSQGPWCYVRWIDELDSRRAGENEWSWRSVVIADYNKHNFRSESNTKRPNESQQTVRFIQRPCALGPCSEYLWLYIIAPPAVVLVLLICLSILLVRRIKRSHYARTQISKTKRRALPKLNKLLFPRGSRYGPKKFGGLSRKTGNYLDDDVFEIVDDLDWSDGQTLSPKSTESFKLNSSSFSSSSSNAAVSELDSSTSSSPNKPGNQQASLSSNRMNGSKSSNPLVDLMSSSPLPSHNVVTTAGDLMSDCPAFARPLNRSVTQVGPMFATLRCHIRGQQQPPGLQQSGSIMGLNQRQPPAHSTVKCQASSNSAAGEYDLPVGVDGNYKPQRGNSIINNMNNSNSIIGQSFGNSSSQSKGSESASSALLSSTGLIDGGGGGGGGSNSIISAIGNGSGENDIGGRIAIGKQQGHLIPCSQVLASTSGFVATKATAASPLPPNGLQPPIPQRQLAALGAHGEAMAPAAGRQTHQMRLDGSLMSINNNNNKQATILATNALAAASDDTTQLGGIGGGSGSNDGAAAAANRRQQVKPIAHDVADITTTTMAHGKENGVKNYVELGDLPQLNAASISAATSSSLAHEAGDNSGEPRLIYEGKFSQVQVAYVARQDQQAATGGCSAGDDNDHRQSDVRQQQVVAVCSLKRPATPTIDPKVFSPHELKVRNLNHLNLIKLIGYFVESVNYEPKNGDHRGAICSLVYDMTNLVDLNDWLKQQNKDLALDQQSAERSLCKNLTCCAKQLALAIDYLHDQGIVYKDLACRNCFIDPSKMLVKLASFNIELVLPENENEVDRDTLSLKSMIRPKYLRDYYVIDSRPLDCQLLPLSWIPLESILFNKFSKQTDVWSFGCLIYELFSLGEVAYFGYTSKQVIDAVRSNLMPPQPILCPGGVYKLMCKCLSDIPTLRPSIKQIYEQLNLFSGQCSSFLDHHLCSLSATSTSDLINMLSREGGDTNNANNPNPSENSKSAATNSMSKTKSYANIKSFNNQQMAVGEMVRNISFGYDNFNLIDVRRQLGNGEFANA